MFNPFMPGLNVFLNNRDHQKDHGDRWKDWFSQAAIILQMNISIIRIHTDSGRIPGSVWKAMQFRSLTITFLEMWNAVSMTRYK